MSVETSLNEPLAASASVIQDSSLSTPLAVLNEWIEEPATKVGLQRCADAAIQKLKADLTLRVPRDPEDRADGFARWLILWKERLGPTIEDEFRHQFPNIAEHLRPGFFDGHVFDHIWSQVEPILLAFAIRGLALSWTTRHLGDAIQLGRPEFVADEWIVPLRLNSHTGVVAEIVLDQNGNIIPERNPTREQLIAHA